MTRQAAAAAVGVVLAFGIARGGAPALVSDLSVAMHDSQTTYVSGMTLTYTIVVANAGPDAASGATVTDTVTTLVPVSGASWTCVATGGATCTAGPVTGNIGDTIDLPVGGLATYTLIVGARAGATADLVNTVTVAPPAGTTDPGPGPDTATDTNTAATLLSVVIGGADSATCGPAAAPCKTIQRAIDNAKAGDAVFVSTGTYNECIVVVPGVGVGGVLVESEELRTQGVTGNTIIDGAGKCDAASGTPGPVAKVYDRGSIRGFVIKNGANSGVWGQGAVSISTNQITTNATSSVGGGIYLVTGVNLSDPFAKAEIRLNTITSNTSAGDGAGIFVDASASGVPSLVEISGNLITTNSAGDGTAGAKGAGIAVVTDTASSADRSDVVISTNTLDGNVAKNATGGASIAYGGGIFVTTGGVAGLGTETVTIGSQGTTNIIRNNVSEGYGGGISVSVRPAPGAQHAAVALANTVTANTGKLGGGGMYLFVHALDQPTGSSPGVSLRASGNSIIGNHAQGDLSDPAALGGGGIFAELDSARTTETAVQFEIDGNTIERNTATTHGGGASLIAFADDDPAGDGATAPADALVSFHHNLVAQNASRDTTASGPTGGGVHGLAVARGAAALAGVSLSFDTIADNETELGTGGIEWQDELIPDSLFAPGAAAFTVSNSIVTGNDGYGLGTAAPLDPSTTVAVSYSDTFGNVSGNFQAPLIDPTGTNGNISIDPALDALFLSRICGPTVDLGDPAIDASEEPLPNGGRVNMGHLGGTSMATHTFPDVNGDGTIDGLDVLGIAVSFAASSIDPRYLLAADRDLNGVVDGSDLAFVSAYYAQSCP
jgi:uncharacterized repeat protein (TIGR01451 family)